ncbi:unnamed protein product [Effrenium voratum]|nr:unnamed protein product [Effrenium voratum]
MVVALVLLVIGCRWLAATQSFADLILNALALEFVINIDELMYEAFTPRSLRNVIELTKLALVTASQKQPTLETTGQLLRNMFFVVALLVWSFMYLNYLQQVLPSFPHDIHDHCSSRFFSKYSVLCPVFGNSEECFPFGRRHAGSTAVTVYWPREQMARLLEFLHGGSFVAKVEDLRVAMDCASFFGVPSLLHHVREWVAANLKVATAPALWKFVESEPHLKDTEYCEDAEDVEAACFEFHLEHFAELAGVKVWESFGDETNDATEEEPPLHNLSVDLFHRLLMSGLVRLPTRQLICVVERFARAKCSDPSSTEAFGQLFTSLMPPAVIFNRDCRTALLQSNENVEVRSLIAV